MPRIAVSASFAPLARLARFVGIGGVVWLAVAASSAPADPAAGVGPDAASASTGTLALDFAKPNLPAGCTLASKQWQVEGGELRGAGDGALDLAGPFGGDFTLVFRGETSEKANFELKLYDASDGRELYTFAFLGRYHSVLDGVKSCLLKGGQFVAVDPRMWTFPGRRFKFEVRSTKGQFQMFLDGVLGPLFVDPQPDRPAGGIRMKLLVATEGSKDRVVLDDVTLEHAKP
jgi:hypothetical protein